MSSILCQYAPQINPGSPLTPMPSTAPTIVVRPTIVLTYSYVSPTITFMLRNPEMGNTERSQMQRIVNRTRGNTVRWYRPQTWPKGRILEYMFRGLSEEEADYYLETFTPASLGKQVGLLDYESKQWVGLITNPQDPITEEGPLCSYTLKLNFEGNLV